MERHFLLSSEKRSKTSDVRLREGPNADVDLIEAKQAPVSSS